MKQKALTLGGAALAVALLTAPVASFAQPGTAQPTYNTAVYASCVSLASNSYVRSHIGRRNIHYSAAAQQREADLKGFCAAYQAQGTQVAANTNFVADCRSAATQNASPLFRLRQDKVEGFQALCSQMAGTTVWDKYK